MNYKTIVASFLILALSVGAYFHMTHGESRSPAKTDATSNATPIHSIIAAPGRVEPLSEEIRIGSELNGKLSDVRVEEGDQVARGQILAQLVNTDYAAQVASSLAQVAEKQSALQKLLNGSRSQERLEALATVKQQEAVLENARADMERHKQLYESGVTSREDADHYEREYKVAKAAHDAELQREALVDDQSRVEDIASARADLALAQAQLAQSRAIYDKTVIRAPISSIVLRRYHRAGESVTNSATAPDPIVSLGDEATLRVRIDVDETDVARIRIGDRAYVTADAFGTRKFWGHIVLIGGELGRKNVRTDEPTERVDTKILETLVQLDDGHELPVGLRVDAFVVPAQN